VIENKSLIFDAHLDLAMNAMEWNRDLRCTVEEIRKSEDGMTDKPDRANGTVSLPSMRDGHIGICVATQIGRYKQGNGTWLGKREVGPYINGRILKTDDQKY
jgi:membrane dipeptidase